MTCTRLFAASRPNSATPQTVGLMATACLHVITKASQTFPVLCTWVPFFLISPTITFRIRYLYRQLLPSCIFLSVIFYFILQWVPTGQRFAWFSASFAASPLPQIKYGKGRKWKTPAEDFREGSPVRSRLKNFAKIPDRTGFCVDTENAAVWASASSAFSVSFLAKFCTSWNLRSSELSRTRKNLHRKSHQSFLNNYPASGILYPYRSSLKYGNPSAAGGWCSFFFRKLLNTSTMILTTYGNALNTSCMLRPSPGI